MRRFRRRRIIVFARYGIRLKGRDNAAFNTLIRKGFMYGRFPAFHHLARHWGATHPFFAEPPFSVHALCRRGENTPPERRASHTRPAVKGARIDAGRAGCSGRKLPVPTRAARGESRRGTRGWEGRGVWANFELVGVGGAELDGDTPRMPSTAWGA